MADESTCTIAEGERISLLDPRLRDCLIGPGTRITMRYDGPVEKALPSGGRKMGAGKPAAAARPDPVEVIDASPLAPVGPPIEPTPVASIGLPTTAAGELGGLLPAGGQLSPLTLVLALIAVLGGGTAWRFYRQRSRERHEREMKELELKAGQPQGPGCQVEHAAVREALARLEARIAELDEAGGTLTKRVARVEARGTDLELPDTVGSLETRVAKLEKAAKAAKGRSAKG